MNSQSQKVRLDQVLAERKLAASRSRARDMILRGCVSVGHNPVNKPGTLVDSDCKISVTDPAQKYVSRAALKLVAGLDAAGIDVDGKSAIDLGASTGGFTQVLLERGAKHVLAIEVGHGQMAEEIAADSRVTLLEGFNARNIDAKTPGISDCDIVVSDLSFVSLKIGAETALRHVAQQAQAVLLVKPQFEVGRDGVGKGGLVSDSTLIDATNSSLVNWFNNLPGWCVTDFLPSPIKGGDGNVEYLLCGERR